MFKNGLKTVMAIALIAILLMTAAQGCGKKEHPEKTEHPDGVSVEVTKDQLADAVEKYVADKSAETEGIFTVVDPKTGDTLELVLDKVHRARLSKVADDKYFACADFTTKDGKVYDLDVFMEGDDKDSLAFSEFSVHKEDGVERYTWFEEGGVWDKKDVGAED
jgi:hypothetical protein